MSKKVVTIHGKGKPRARRSETPRIPDSVYADCPRPRGESGSDRSVDGQRERNESYWDAVHWGSTRLGQSMSMAQLAQCYRQIGWGKSSAPMSRAAVRLRHDEYEERLVEARVSIEAQLRGIVERADRDDVRVAALRELAKICGVSEAHSLAREQRAHLSVIADPHTDDDPVIMVRSALMEALRDGAHVDVVSKLASVYARLAGVGSASDDGDVSDDDVADARRAVDEITRE